MIRPDKPKPRRKLTLSVSESLLGYALLVPTFLLIGVVIIYPIFYNIIMSFHKVSLNPNKASTFIGLDNYTRMLSDPGFYRSLLITVLYVAITVFLSTTIGLLVALLMNKPFIGRKLARSLVLLPYVAPMVALAYVWQYMFNGLYGMVNYVLVDLLHLFPTVPMWFDHPVYSIALVVLFDAWRVFPYSFLMILAALQAIDQTIYEAAEVDGANKWRKFWAITFPDILPSVAAILTLRTIWNFYKFDDIYIFTKNVPVLGVYLYQTAFAGHDNGRAAAITIVLFVIVFSFVLLLGRKVARR